MPMQLGNKSKMMVISMTFVLGLSGIAGSSKETTYGINYTVGYFKTEAAIFANTTDTLQNAITVLNPSDSLSVLRIKKLLVDCRIQYKKIEFFLRYFFPSATAVYNSPPIFEIEEPSLEYQEPMGLQQIEALLFQPITTTVLQELNIQAETINSSAADLPSLLFKFQATDAQVFEALRIELIRVMTLTITGYDAPELKSGIREAYTSILSIREVLTFYCRNGEQEKLMHTVDGALRYLQHNFEFDSFNRMDFLTLFAMPMQSELNVFIESSDQVLNTTGFLNYAAKNIFSRDVFDKTSFLGRDGSSAALINLGKKLFLETALSGTGTRSCKSCHNPEMYFTDRLSVNRSLGEDSPLQRNTPSLLYSSFQHAQFWDGRAKQLTDQIRIVIADSLEMNGNEINILNYLNKEYKSDFQGIFKEPASKSIVMDQVAEAMAAYIATLHPMNSAFDKYMSGDHHAMTKDQVKGFNLFMGKAKCATCHFAPLFNSLLPPGFDITEYEVIGTTKTDDFDNPEKDEDLGRFNSHPIRFYQQAFKTPTVRNSAVTAPYMHNGEFKDIKSVIEFYDRGGGHGLGVMTEYQTLSSAPLNLSEKEKEEILKFLESLTDEPIY